MQVKELEYAIPTVTQAEIDRAERRARQLRNEAIRAGAVWIAARIRAAAGRLLTKMRLKARAEKRLRARRNSGRVRRSGSDPLRSGERRRSTARRRFPRRAGSA